MPTPSIRGRLFIISAPSGAGKTSLVKHLVAHTRELSVSISHTTRPMRPGEINGQDYFFVSDQVFVEMLEQQAFLEHAKVYDNFYGTAQHNVDVLLNDGQDVILEIDWQGAEQVKKALPDSVAIFIFPPSIDVLQKRLLARGQDSEAVIARRMRDAIAEMSHYRQFDYLIVNDDFQQAFFEIQSIITAYRLRRERQQHNLQPLLANLFA
ncbi:MAG: guanylate kinase [Methylococcales bacterium]